ncbi:MAG: hypothetical protein AAGD25_23230 [Cyanobacteria bacterium P01_F01_bin.150]
MRSSDAIGSAIGLSQGKLRQGKLFQGKLFQGKLFLDKQNLFLLLSIAAPFYYGAITLHHAFSHPFMVQDDMRQHVVWFYQFIDPGLFPEDIIADYFRSVAPWGVSAFYWLGAKVGLTPLVLAKLLPLPLGLIATVFFFFTTLELIPIPFAAWLSTLIFNQHLWLNDDLVTATPRAFVYPLFSAFLYFLVRRLLLPMLVAIALLGLFFPQMMLVALAILGIRLMQGTWANGRLRLQLTFQGQPWRYALLGLLVATMVVVPFALNLSDYGSAVTAEQMRSQLEYQAQGRNAYFGVHPLSFVLHGSSGLRIPVFPSIIWAGFALPLLIRNKRFCSSHIIQAITPKIRLLLDLTLASFILYFAAHALLLRLHFPSRYLYHSWRFILAIASGIVLAALGEMGWRWWQKWRSPLSRILLRLIIMPLILVLLLVPLWPPLVFAFQGWVQGETPDIYAYLAKQPTDTLVASLAPEADNIPAFTLLSTWTGREFSLPHHPQYYTVVRQRTADLLQALYSSDLRDIQRLIDRTGIDFFLIETDAFESRYLDQDWLLHSSLQPQVKEIMEQLESGAGRAIASHIPTCAVASTKQYALLDSTCLTNQMN